MTAIQAILRLMVYSNRTIPDLQKYQERYLKSRKFTICGKYINFRHEYSKIVELGILFPRGLRI
jgi:hypothetical protein